MTGVLTEARCSGYSRPAARHGPAKRSAARRGGKHALQSHQMLCSCKPGELQHALNRGCGCCWSVDTMCLPPQAVQPTRVATKRTQVELQVLFVRRHAPQRLQRAPQRAHPCSRIGWEATHVTAGCGGCSVPACSACPAARPPLQQTQRGQQSTLPARCGAPACSSVPRSAIARAAKHCTTSRQPTTPPSLLSAAMALRSAASSSTNTR